jgi:diguanylate cyclase (GGDEF)-like protein
MGPFSVQDTDVLLGRIDHFKREYLGRLEAGVLSVTNTPLPPGVLEQLKKELVRLYHDIHTTSRGRPLIYLDNTHGPLLKRLVLHYRREVADSVEARASHVHDEGVLDAIRADLRPFDSLMAGEWFHQFEACPVPHLSDFLSVEKAEEVATKKWKQQAELAPRAYDQKFHILQAPFLFTQDLGYYREKCSLRGLSVAAAFVDIDDFKKFNTAHTHEVVDRVVLPRFMRAVEAHVFARGHAYQHGGDEYLVLLPNTSAAHAIEVLDELRRRVAGLEYPGVRDRTTVSIGACLVGPDCFLTNEEVRDRANRAAAYAKDQGRNRVATYKGDLFRPGDLYVAAPVE